MSLITRTFLLMMCWMACQSSVLADIYRVTTDVEGRGSQERSAGLARAFNEVLVRASGKAEVVANATVRKANPQSYIETFGYTTSQESGEPLLEVVFNQAQVEGLLGRAGFAVWGINRPSVMMWVGVEDGGRQLVTASDLGDLAIFRYALVRRGVPAVWPLGDLQDEMALPMSRLFGLFRQDAREASARYPSSALLTAKVERYGNRWQLDGFLEHRGDSRTLSLKASEPSEMAALLADWLAEYFSGRYGVSTHASGAGVQAVQVSGMSSFGEYQEVLKLLKSANGVQSVSVAGMSDDVLTVQLGLRASWSQVRANLRLDPRLVPSASDSVFEWRAR